MKLKISLFGVLIAASLTMLTWADPAVRTIEQSEGMLMRSKMKRSQSVLEGLLRKDFKAIERGAHEMKLISEAAEWPRARDAVYEHFSAEFRRQCNQLEELAPKGGDDARNGAWSCRFEAVPQQSVLKRGHGDGGSRSSI